MENIIFIGVQKPSVKVISSSWPGGQCHVLSKCVRTDCCLKLFPTARLFPLFSARAEDVLLISVFQPSCTESLSLRYLVQGLVDLFPVD